MHKNKIQCPIILEPLQATKMSVISRTFIKRESLQLLNEPLQ